MQFQEQVLINAAPEKIFKLYADVANWATWDTDVKSSAIHGAFIAGAKGMIQPSKGPKSNIAFTQVEENRLFTVESKLPLCTMKFEHELSAHNGQTQVIHRVSFIGLLAPIFGRLIGSQIHKNLPATLQGLKQAAEK